MDKMKYNQIEANSNRTEKIIIIYLIMIALILMYFSQFFVHDIVDRGIAGDGKGVTIPFSQDEDKNKTDEKNNNGENGDGTDGSENNGDGNGASGNNGTGANGTGANGTGNSTTGGNNGNSPTNEIIDNSSRIKIREGSTEWSELKELGMFKNYYFNDRAIIAPGVSGSYTYTVENESTSTFNYSIKYTPENPYNVNMQYRLKKNGKYVFGGDGTWHSYTELDRANDILGAGKTDVYTVEWKWVDTSYDTPIGETEGAYYKMYIKVLATQVIP